MSSESKSRRAGGAPGPPGKKAAQARQQHRARLSMDPEQSTRMLLIGAVIGIVALSLGIIGFGYWYSVVRPRNRTVLSVDGVTVSYASIKRRMAYELFQNPTYQQAPTTLATGVLQQLTNELTVIAKAESGLGITLSDDEFNARLQGAVGSSGSSDGRAFADALKRTLDSAGLTDAEFRRKTRAEALAQKISQKFQAELPATAMQAKVEVIATKEEADAKKAVDRVNAGEDWATVARAASAEPDVQTTGGLHDYAPQGTLDPAYDALAFSAAIGEVSQPLLADNGYYYVIRVVDRADKPVTDAQKPQLTSKAVNDWLSQQQAEMAISQDFDTASQNDALASAEASVFPKLIQQQIQQQQLAQPTVAAQPPPADSGDQGGQSPVPNVPAPGGGDGQ